MTRSAATQIAGYLTTGFYRDMGYAAPPFDRQAGDGLTVWMDLSDRADRGIVRLALDAWSTVTGLRFALDGRAGDHDLRFTDAGRGAYSYSTHARDGERLSAVVNMGQDWLDAYGGGAVSYYTQSWIHEIGHALGLGHAGPYDSQASWGDQRFGLDSWQMSVMSYFSPAENPNVSASRGYVLTPMPADIIAIQDLYGAPDDRGADVYGFGGTAGGIYARFGEMLDRGQMSVPILLTIWDGGGRDMLNLSRDSHDQRIDLRPGAFSDVLGWKGTLGIAYGTAIEDARGGRGADWVIGNGTANRIWGHQGDDQLRGGGGRDRLHGGYGDDTLLSGTGNDTLNGYAGDDVLSGQAGDDLLIGGGGADRFVFRLRGDNGHDRIADFTPGEDVLDLRWLGLERIAHGTGGLYEGLLRIVERGADVVLRADLDQDGRAELDILLRDGGDVGRDDLLI
ncbi:MAG: M10 family metallopeptidase [Paracoccus sp. (in: a-proteobacteria)]|jgi:serralysin|uniref:M10 family metallopeptidase n=2 Tax=Paracoccus sp. TaxID=267 RepID=UPI0025D76C9A|nr:M10 family metallopeptidase [Paracoccus sp. (in: a-proteobacteria)]MCS5601570.1 M10 family metallopeptidase C-terminal domain-containing protein [Paracoccus sp. (in: a-proteobacteria)]|tara:strand:- start:1643 stop:2995 length:1353 start_codon:yes stop_codon:yes gene_type:complete